MEAKCSSIHSNFFRAQTSVGLPGHTLKGRTSSSHWESRDLCWGIEFIVPDPPLPLKMCVPLKHRWDTLSSQQVMLWQASCTLPPSPYLTSPLWRIPWDHLRSPLHMEIERQIVFGRKETKIISLNFLTEALYAKSLQSCPTLCDPTDCSPPGSSVRGIFQARIWSGLPCPSPGIFPTQRSNPRLSCLLYWQGGSLLLASPGKPGGSTFI